MENIRAKNLDLIRWMNYGHKYTAEKLKNVISNECLLSEMALGKKVISDFDARNIETELALPTGWLDRDNVSIITTLTELDHKLFQDLKEYSVRKKQGLSNFISNK